MGVVIPLGFGQAKIRWTFVGGGPEMICTFGYDGDVAEVPATDASEIDVIMRAAGRPAVAANFSSGWSYQGVDCTRMTATGPITGRASTLVQGSASMSTLPNNTAFLLKKNTAHGGRMGIGRCFLPPIWVAENNVDGAGVIASTNLATMQAFWTSALTALLASDCPPVLLHSDGSTPTPITSWTIQSIVATQRRRLHR